MDQRGAMNLFLSKRGAKEASKARARVERLSGLEAGLAHGTRNRGIFTMKFQGALKM